MSKYIMVMTTIGSRNDAENISRVLVEKRLAACVQVTGPVQSTYWWQGKIEKAEEYLCFIKTRRMLFSKVEKAIKVIHPYTVPEIISLRVEKGSRDYLKWLVHETA